MSGLTRRQFVAGAAAVTASTTLLGTAASMKVEYEILRSINAPYKGKYIATIVNGKTRLIEDIKGSIVYART